MRRCRQKRPSGTARIKTLRSPFPPCKPIHRPSSPFTAATETLIGGRYTAGIPTVIVSDVGEKSVRVRTDCNPEQTTGFLGVKRGVPGEGVDGGDFLVQIEGFQGAGRG